MCGTSPGRALRPRERRYERNTRDIAEVWRRGSVVGSWLLDLAAMALAESPDLPEFSGSVQDWGEGRWTIVAALEEAAPADGLSAMRNKFGGRVERPAGG